jgi:hypothetical protein
MKLDVTEVLHQLDAKPVVLLLLAVLVTGCDEQPREKRDSDPSNSTDVTDTKVIDADARSASDDTDISTDTEEAGDGVTTDATDSGGDKDASALPSFFFRESYLCDATGRPALRHEVGYTFRELDRGGGGPLTAQDVREFRGGEIDVDGGWMSAPASLDPGERSYAMWTKDGEDLTLYTGTFTKTQLDGATLSVTAMVDYEPVSATYRLWDPEREQLLEETTATGIHVPMDTQVEVVDIVIPAETFDEDRMYEIAVAHVADGQDKWIERNFFRVTLYKQGYDLPAHPCFEPALPSDRTPVEQAIVASHHYGTVTLYPSDLEDPAELKSPISARPGEEMTIEFFVVNSTLPYATSIGLVPLLNGKPLDKRWFYVRPSYDDAAGNVQYRGEFEVTLPSEPGIHEITMTRWEFPFMPIENERGIKTDTPYMRHGGGSRTLRFDVQ